jgi:hypothetical protein
MMGNNEFEKIVKSLVAEIVERGIKWLTIF